MDISKIRPNERVIDILSPKTGKELDIKVSIISLKDPKMLKIKRNLLNKRLVLEKKGKFFDCDDVEENEITILLNAVTGWVWGKDASFNGEKPEFNEKNFRNIVKELPWFKEQLMEAIGDDQAFF